MLLMTCADSASARDYLNCLANKVVIVDAASGSTSSKTEENLGFWIDETAFGGGHVCWLRRHQGSHVAVDDRLGRAIPDSGRSAIQVEPLASAIPRTTEAARARHDGCTFGPVRPIAASILVRKCGGRGSGGNRSRTA
jgi:hypothetical protein